MQEWSWSDLDDCLLTVDEVRGGVSGYTHALVIAPDAAQHLDSVIDQFVEAFVAHPEVIVVDRRIPELIYVQAPTLPPGELSMLIAETWRGSLWAPEEAIIARASAGSIAAWGHVRTTSTPFGGEKRSIFNRS